MQPPTDPDELQLPAKRVIEGTVIEPLRIRIEVNVLALKNLEADLRMVCEALHQIARATTRVRPVYPFEQLDKGAIDLAHPPQDDQTQHHNQQQQPQHQR